MSLTKKQQEDLIAETKRQEGHDVEVDIDVEKLSTDFGKGYAGKKLLVTRGVTLTDLLE